MIRVFQCHRSRFAAMSSTMCYIPPNLLAPTIFPLDTFDPKTFTQPYACSLAGCYCISVFLVFKWVLSLECSARLYACTHKVKRSVLQDTRWLQNTNLTKQLGVIQYLANAEKETNFEIDGERGQQGEWNETKERGWEGMWWKQEGISCKAAVTV